MEKLDSVFLFQFHKVRLKALTYSRLNDWNVFQFHKVRLKEAVATRL